MNTIYYIELSCSPPLKQFDRIQIDFKDSDSSQANCESTLFALYDRSSSYLVYTFIVIPTAIEFSFGNIRTPVSLYIYIYI